MSGPAPFSFEELLDLLRSRQVADAPCPLCSPLRKAINRNKPVLRLWRIEERLVSCYCVHCEASGYVWEGGEPGRIDPVKLADARRQRDEFERKSQQQKIASARRLWAESVDPRGTWAEEYLHSRGLRLPADPEILLRTLRFHPRCPFPDGWSGPALLAAFTPILTGVPDDPLLDPPPVAIHRIRGRGHDNKAMLGPVKGSSVMISPWWHVWDTLNVCEGVETALALRNEGAADPDDCHRPVWALGNDGAIRALPIIARVRQLRIFADNDASRAGMDAAKEVAHRWQQAGIEVVVRHLRQEGTDYADRAG